jgi:colicin import membrane protein
MPTELDVARSIRDGVLPSPQKIGTMWLWDIRISGSGAAYRPSIKEFVWRDPSIVLSDETVARVAGLPVIWRHPEEVSKLNSEEFGARVIGTVMLAYVSGDELRGVCRIYDSEAIRRMAGSQLSTSPGVVFGPESHGQSFKVEDGHSLLFEGDPQIWDHIAVLGEGEAGVWDKLSDPSGVLTTALTQGTEMAEDDKAAAARDDAAKLDAVLDALKGLSGRMDSYDAARKDAEEKEREDRARKDAADAEEKAKADRARRDAARKDRFGARKDGESDEDMKKRFDADEDDARKDAMEEGCEETVAADRARKDRKDAETAEEARALEKANKAREDAARKDAAGANAEIADLKSQLAALTASMREVTRQTSAADRDALAQAQSKFDSVAAMHGERADPPLPGESPLAYRKRNLDRFKKHSAQFKESRFDSLDTAMLEPIEKIIVDEAVEAARKDSAGGAGLLFAEHYHDDAGRKITKWHGDNLAWMAPFMTDGISGSFIRPQRGI